METKITVIVDNIACNNLTGEWGLCMLVEFREKKILVDAGASELFATNLEKLGFDIRDIDYATLSHAHYDHANGIPRFLKENNKAKFYIQKAARDNCYFKRLFLKKYIGMPKNILANNPDRIEQVSGDYELMQGAYLIPHKTPGLEKIGRKEAMYQKTEKGYVPDNFNHEQSLVLDTDKGLVIVNCCSHGGAVNIINEVKATFPEKEVYGLIGGFHLFNKKESEIRELSRKIKETGIHFVCTGHCTGKRAFDIMNQELGEMVKQLNVGLVMNF